MKLAFDEVRNEVVNLNSFVQERVTGMNVFSFLLEKIELENSNKLMIAIKSMVKVSITLFFPVAEIFSSLTLGL